MITQWRFDENNPYEDSFEESMLSALASQHVFNVVKRRLLAVQKDPKAVAAYRDVVRGRPVYIVLTGPGLAYGNTIIEPFLIVYTLQERDKLIQRVFVGRAAEYLDNPHASVIEDIAPALRGAIGRALQNAGSKPRH